MRSPTMARPFDSTPSTHPPTSNRGPASGPTRRHTIRRSPTTARRSRLEPTNAYAYNLRGDTWSAHETIRQGDRRLTMRPSRLEPGQPYVLLRSRHHPDDPCAAARPLPVSRPSSISKAAKADRSTYAVILGYFAAKSVGNEPHAKAFLASRPSNRICRNGRIRSSSCSGRNRRAALLEKAVDDKRRPMPDASSVSTRAQRPQGRGPASTSAGSATTAVPRRSYALLALAELERLEKPEPKSPSAAINGVLYSGRARLRPADVDAGSPGGSPSRNRARPIGRPYSSPSNLAS